MSLLQSYIRKKQCRPSIKAEPHKDLGYIVVIPVYHEPEFTHTLDSLAAATPPEKKVEVIPVFNAGRESSQHVISQNRKTFHETLQWHQNNRPFFNLHPIILENIAPRDMGVGYARKAGMDEAILRFDFVVNEKGVILSLDADTLCQSNYFVEIEKAFRQDPKLNGGTLHFEHPVGGDKFNSSIYEAVQMYELFLRYYKRALIYSAFPYAFHTIGSAFFVKASAYAKQGGMNRKKAGEDFYFLNKVFQLGHIKEIFSTTVFPSPRPSERVLFGTGPEVKKHSTSTSDEYLTYHTNVFRDLRLFFTQTEELFHMKTPDIGSLQKPLPEYLTEFLKENKANLHLERIKNNAASCKTFRKQFFHWFDGLKIIRSVHRAHEHEYKKIPLQKAAMEMLKLSSNITTHPVGHKQLLDQYIKLERANPVVI